MAPLKLCYSVPKISSSTAIVEYFWPSFTTFSVLILPPTFAIPLFYCQIILHPILIFQCTTFLKIFSWSLQSAGWILVDCKMHRVLNTIRFMAWKLFSISNTLKLNMNLSFSYSYNMPKTLLLATDISISSIKVLIPYSL